MIRNESCHSVTCPWLQHFLSSNSGWASSSGCRASALGPHWRATDLQWKHFYITTGSWLWPKLLLILTLWVVTAWGQGLEVRQCRLTCSLPSASLVASWLTDGAGHAWSNGHSSWTVGHTWGKQISFPLCGFAGVWTVHQNGQTSFHSPSSYS